MIRVRALVVALLKLIVVKLWSTLAYRKVTHEYYKGVVRYYHAAVSERQPGKIDVCVCSLPDTT